MAESWYGLDNTPALATASNAQKNYCVMVVVLSSVVRASKPDDRFVARVFDASSG